MPSEARRPAKYAASLILPDLVMPVGLVAHEAPDDVIGLAAGMTGPAGQRLVEIDIDHHAAEIEQQRVGGAG